VKKADVKIGGEYRAKVSGGITTVKILNESPLGGWDARNVRTGRIVRIRTAARLQWISTGKIPGQSNGQHLEPGSLVKELVEGPPNKPAKWLGFTAQSFNAARSVEFAEFENFKGTLEEFISTRDPFYYAAPMFTWDEYILDPRMVIRKMEERGEL